MDLFALPLQTACCLRYCLPDNIGDLPHVTRQISAFLDTFSADWTMLIAYRKTRSFLWVKFVAARELPETQDPFYKRWLLNRTAELAASRGDLPTLQWLMEIYLPVELVDNVVEVAAAFGCLDILQWLYDHHTQRVHFGKAEMCGAIEDKHDDVVNWLWEHTVPAAEYRDKILWSAAEAGNMNILKWLCAEFNLDPIKALQPAIDGCNWKMACWINERYDTGSLDPNERW
ncbi:LOW QUALITY PROTEIN: hypothetical protein PHMEG_00026769 [Phytophthora megakarya]|uniref:Uncharacterized protein n=1 Tax=Phytophthora megakarya TaxID=4795 RepID=A0A225V9M1_9STRA|nr:LOW QUALITY PROTEIN: hypothetical protein PHMEG_00026769 [Phytophthora megakarya]